MFEDEEKAVKSNRKGARKPQERVVTRAGDRNAPSRERSRAEPSNKGGWRAATGCIYLEASGAPSEGRFRGVEG